MLREQLPEKKYRIVIADDHPIVRRGVRMVIEAGVGMEVCAEASNGLEAVEHVKQHAPDLVVMDLIMPEMDGMEATRQVREISPATEVLVFSTHFADGIARDLLRSGARGYVLKTDPPSELAAAIDRIRHKGTFFTSCLAESMTGSYINQLEEGEGGALPGTSLTPREVQVVQLLAQGKCNKEVAVALDVSTRTVESHRTHIMRKMKFANYAELVRFAVRNNLVEP
ncbi:MAG: response regulator [Candidatus Acidiferrales bacterium]